MRIVNGVLHGGISASSRPYTFSRMNLRVFSWHRAASTSNLGAKLSTNSNSNLAFRNFNSNLIQSNRLCLVGLCSPLDLGSRPFSNGNGNGNAPSNNGPGSGSSSTPAPVLATEEPTIAKEKRSADAGEEELVVTKEKLAALNSDAIAEEDATAEAELATAKEKFADAERKFADAEKELTTANKELVTARQDRQPPDVVDERKERVDQALQLLSVAQQGVTSAQQGVTTAQDVVIAAYKPPPNLESFRSTSTAGWQANPAEVVWANDLRQTELQPVQLERGDREELERRGLSIEHGVSVLRTQSVIEEYSPDVFVRQSTVELYEAIVQHFDTITTTKPYAAVIGNPGIGKSRSIDYFIWRLLRADKRIVLQGKTTVFLFELAPDGRYKAFSTSVGSFNPTGCEELTDKNTWYLIDPNICTKVMSVRARTVLFSSPFQARYEEWLKPAGGGEFYAFPHSLTEMLAVRPTLAPNMSAAEVLHRCDVVGPVTRLVFDDGHFQVHPEKMIDAATTIPTGALNALLKQQGVTLNNMSSKLFCFFPPQSPPERFKVYFISFFAKLCLVFELKDRAQHHHDRSADWFLIEEFASRCILPQGCEQVAGGTGSKRQVFDMIASLPTAAEVDRMSIEQRRLFKMPPGFPLVDYVDACDRGYHVTNAVTHSINYVAFRRGLDQALHRANHSDVNEHVFKYKVLCTVSADQFQHKTDSKEEAENNGRISVQDTENLWDRLGHFWQESITSSL